MTWFKSFIDSESSPKLLLLGYLVIEVWDHDFGNPDDRGHQKEE